MNFKKIVLWLAGILAVLALLFYFFFDVNMLIDRVVSGNLEQNATVEAALLDKDKITVVLIGTGSPMPSDRAQTCTGVFVNGQFLMFDAGDGASRSIDNLKLPIGSLNAVFLTHYHYDHYADLAVMMDRSWIMGRRDTLEIYGGKGLNQIVKGIQDSYELEYSYRTAHHGEETMPSKAVISRANEISDSLAALVPVIYDKDGVQVTIFPVDHAPIFPAVGYKITYKGKSVVISGDTKYCKMLEKQSDGADILVSEIMAMAVIEKIEAANKKNGFVFGEKVMKDIRGYHIGIPELGGLAERAKVKNLMLTHLVPSPVNGLFYKQWYETPIKKHYTGNLAGGSDGAKLVLDVE